MVHEHKWSTLRISFGYLDCPSCKQEIKLAYQVPNLSHHVDQQFQFRARVEDLATKKAIEEGFDKKGRVVTEGDIYFNDLKSFAMNNCAYYQCHKCKKPYFGGMQDCAEAMQQSESTKKEDLMCPPCK